MNRVWVCLSVHNYLTPFLFIVSLVLVITLFLFFPLTVLDICVLESDNANPLETL